jgi:signal transduction histidine kinase
LPSELENPEVSERAPEFSSSAESLALLYDVADVLERGVLVLDAELRVRGWNRWLVSASGLEASQVVGRVITEAFPELRDRPAEEAFRRALTGSTTMWSHQFHRHLLPFPPPPDFPRFPLMQQTARILPLLNETRVDGVLVIVDDVTERVAREEELRQALQRAEVASQAKSDFLASMSHELRTPLSAIVGYMDLMTSEIIGPIDALQKNYLGRVKAAAVHLISIIEEILTFSRVAAGRESVHPETLDVCALARDVEELFVPQAQHKQLQLHVSTPASRVLLWTDATKLRQILINLVGNAMKFTTDGSVSLGVSVEDERVLFAVVDTGPGIPEADLERIFQPFTQLDQSLRREKGGTGLGLPVSRKLAELLGGELSVESVPGRGTTFTLWLPRREGPRAFASMSEASESLLPQQ